MISPKQFLRVDRFFRRRFVRGLAGVLALFLWGAGGMAAPSTAVPDTAYLFSYFVGNGEDGLHLAWSPDGLKWEALDEGRSYLKPAVGKSKLMRDPCIVRGPKGVFHMVWTDSWDSQTIGYASSRDLIRWSSQKAIPVMQHEPTVRNCWAPEIVYDQDRQEFRIFWASTIPGRFPETWFDGKNDNNHRIYSVTTTDFETFSPTEVFFEPGFNVIDSTLFSRNGKVYMVFKDETKHPRAMKNLGLAVADQYAGPYTVRPEPINAPGSWVEGPTTLEIGGNTYVYLDAYTRHHYAALRSRDLEQWEDITGLISFPPGTRHGTAIEVPGSVVRNLISATTSSTAALKFDFGAGRVEPGFTQVLPDMDYTAERGFGFDLGSLPDAVARDGGNAFQSDLVTASEPFFFSVHLPEGNYNVAVTFGDRESGSTNTVKAESRRLMLERVVTQPDEFVTHSFTVNTRTPALPDGRSVSLKKREHGVLHWDDKLTLEFNGAHPAVCGLEITPSTNAITVFLLGDSTVTDQPKEPWNSWGQMLTRFFQPDVVVANHAESGESLKNSLSARRVRKVMSKIKPGDYLFVQFGHNDMKDKATNALAIYKSNLEKLVEQTRSKGATPVLVTSMERKAGLKGPTLKGYPDTVRTVVREQEVALIDLNRMSVKLYAALGGDLDRAFQDGTHHNAYGSYQLARCIVQGIRQNDLPLAGFLVEDVPEFDPSHPDSLDAFDIPASPFHSTEKPDGS